MTAAHPLLAPRFRRIREAITDQSSFDAQQRYVADGLGGTKKHGPIQKIWDTVQELWGYAKSVEIPWYKKTLPLAGLVYLVTPVDVIPDFFPALGFVDDAAIIAGIAVAVGSSIRTITDATIDAKIDGVDRAVRDKVVAIYRNYRKNRFVAGIASTVVIALAVAAYCFDAANTVILCTISLVTTAFLLRALFGLWKAVVVVAKNVGRPITFPSHGEKSDGVTLDVTYGQAAKVFCADLTAKRSLSAAIEAAIRSLWRQFYAALTGKSAKTIHCASGTIRLIKTPEAIEEDVVRDFKPLIMDYLWGNFAYKAIGLIIFYGAFLAFVKLNVFRWTLHMGLLKILFYPFSVALPALFHSFF